MIKGIDISEWQGDIDFDKLPEEVKFIIVRSSFGTGYTDKKFSRNLEEARKREIPCGFYHYAYPTYNTPEAEADWFVSVNNDLKSGDVLVLDFEEKYDDPVGWSKRFLDRVSSKLNNYKPIIYLNKFTTMSYDWSPVVNGNYGLWLAYWDYDYHGECPDTPWSVVAMRQYSNNGSISGISGRVDENVFYGTVEDFKKYGIDIPSTSAIGTLEEKIDALMEQLEKKNALIDLLNEDLEKAKSTLTTLQQAIQVNKTPLSAYTIKERLVSIWETIWS